jgi:hypothetical protein
MKCEAKPQERDNRIDKQNFLELTPSAQEALQKVTDEYQRQLANYSPDQLELEIRFGTLRSHHHFVPGVRVEDYQLIADKLQRYEGWDRRLEPHESFNYYYSVPMAASPDIDSDNDQSQKTVQVRTTCQVLNTSINDGEVSTQDTLPDHEGKPRLEVITVRKEKLMEVTLHSPTPSAGGEGLDFRVSLSAEVKLPLSSPFQASLVRPQHVRIKQRNSYQKGAWRYDLTLVWEGRTRAEAEHAQQVGGRTRYEVEIEYATLPAQNQLEEGTIARKSKQVDTLSGASIGSKTTGSNFCNYPTISIPSPQKIYYKVHSLARLVNNQTCSYIAS